MHALESSRLGRLIRLETSVMQAPVFLVWRIRETNKFSSKEC
jgi:hypothetical protein